MKELRNSKWNKVHKKWKILTAYARMRRRKKKNIILTLMHVVCIPKKFKQFGAAIFEKSNFLMKKSETSNGKTPQKWPFLTKCEKIHSKKKLSRVRHACCLCFQKNEAIWTCHFLEIQFFNEQNQKWVMEKLHKNGHFSLNVKKCIVKQLSRVRHACCLCFQKNKQFGPALFKKWQF